jgi:hypothetical protein
MVVASSAALAQFAQDPDTSPSATTTDATPGDAAPKPKKQKTGKKTEPGTQPAKTDSADAKPKAGQYATEGEARSHCRGTVVWIDKDNFNHYAGSREYGRKPGAFGCEKG